MSDKPIIFSGPMVRALIEGRKTQTRRILKPRPVQLHAEAWDYKGACWAGVAGAYCSTSGPSVLDLVPYAAGDRLWVREAHSIYLCEPGCWYWADGRVAEYDATPPRPSIHMFRWCSRLTLTVTEVRVQRLQEISEADSIAEGIYRSEPTDDDRRWHRSFCEENGGDPDEPMDGVWMAPGARQGWGMTKAERDRDRWGPTAAFAYRCVWNSLYGDGAWDSNPWVIALTFAVEQQNIDAGKMAA